MRRLLRDVAEDQALGDTTTLADPAVVDGIKARYLAAATDRGVSASACATPRALDLARRSRSTPGPAVVVDIDGVLSDAAEPPALPRGAAPRLARVLRRVRRGPGDRGGARRSSTCSTRRCRSCCSPRGPHRVHHLTEAWLRRYEIRWDLLIMRPWGDYELARDFKQSTVWELRAAGFDLAPGLRGRPPQRRDVPLRGHPLPLRPLRLLRLTVAIRLTRSGRRSRRRTGIGTRPPCPTR